MLTLAVKRLTSTAVLPLKGSADAACFDLHVDSVEEERDGWTVHTGLSVAIPTGYGMFIFPRSGLSTKLGLTLRNGTGVIDSDYRGEILLKLNTGTLGMYEHVKRALQPGSRIAQATVLQVPDIQFMEVSQLPETARGTGGFGSTGV